MGDGSVIYSWGGLGGNKILGGGSKLGGGTSKKFSPAAGIVTDLFCWRVSSEPQNFSKKDSVLLSKLDYLS